MTGAASAASRPGAAEPVPAVVTLDLWRVPATRLPLALARMAVDRGRVRGLPGLRFAKLLGTGSGRTFSPGMPTCATGRC